MTTKELRVAGMSCGHCVMTLKKELSRIEGLEVEDVQVGSARVRFDETRVDLRAVEQAVRKAGFEPAGA